MTAVGARGEAANVEAIQAWDDSLSDRFGRFRHIVTSGLGTHGEAGSAAAVAAAGAAGARRWLGFGDTTR